MALGITGNTPLLGGIADFGSWLTQSAPSGVPLPGRGSGPSGGAGFSFVPTAYAEGPSGQVQGAQTNNSGYTIDSNPSGLNLNNVTVANPTNPTPPPSGGNNGGGGGNNGSSIIPSGQPGSGMTIDQYLKDLQYRAEQEQRDREAAYNSSNDYLNQAENAVRADYPSALSEAQANYDTNASSLAGSRDKGFNTLADQQTQAGQGQEDALSAARRLYQEQQIGTSQRFGGSSSAGGALSELQSRSLAENMGQTQRQYANVVHSIQTQHNQIESDYNTGLLQLQQAKQTAVDNATRDFNNKLLQISQNRAQLSQDKANASLAALQDLRNKIFSIETQNTQFQQQLELQKQQAQLGLQNYGQSVLGATNTSAQAVSNPYATYNTQYGATGQASPTQTPQFTGAVSPSKDPNQQLTGSIGYNLNPLSRDFLTTGP